MCLNFCAAIPRKHWHVSICLSPCLCLYICLFQIRGFHPLLNAIPRQYWPVWVGNQIKPTAFSTSSSYKTFFRQRKNIPATPSLAALCTVQLIWLGIYVSALLESIHCRRQNAPMLLLYLITIIIIIIYSRFACNHHHHSPPSQVCKWWRKQNSIPIKLKRTNCHRQIRHTAPPSENQMLVKKNGQSWRMKAFANQI